MLRAIVWIVMVALVLSACDRKPKGLLPEPELTRLMIDFYLQEARISSLHATDDSARKMFEVYEKKFLEQEGIPDSTLRKTYTYYMEHPKELERIYDIVIDSLSLREQRATVVAH